MKLCSVCTRPTKNVRDDPDLLARKAHCDHPQCPWCESCVLNAARRAAELRREAAKDAEQ